MADLECATLAATTLHDMAIALKQEFFADLEAKNAKPRGGTGGGLKLVE